MSKKYHYCYITTNLINGKQYVGDHSTNNLDDGYLGSGTGLKLAIKKYGKEKFKKEILEFLDNKNDAFDAQIGFINEYDTLAPNGYNISPHGGYGVNNSELNESTKKKLSELRMGDKNPNFGVELSLKDKIIRSKQLKKFYEKNVHPNKNKTYEELYGIEEAENKISVLKNNPGFMLGKIHSYESRQKMSEAKKGDKNPNKKGLSKEHIEKIRQSNIGWKHTPETIEYLKFIQSAPRPNRKKRYEMIGPDNKKYTIDSTKELLAFLKNQEISVRKIKEKIKQLNNNEFGEITEKDFQYLCSQSKKSIGWKIKTI